MLNVDRMSVAMLNVVMLSVSAPSFKNEKKVFFVSFQDLPSVSSNTSGSGQPMLRPARAVRQSYPARSDTGLEGSSGLRTDSL